MDCRFTVVVSYSARSINVADDVSARLMLV